jgi:hypothetical protein
MWLVLTRTTGDVPAHVNMELATWMWRMRDATEIVFGKEFTLLVKETPEEIRGLTKSLTSEPFVDRM